MEEKQTTKRRLTAAVQRQTQRVGVCDPQIAATFSNPKSINNSLGVTFSVFQNDFFPLLAQQQQIFRRMRNDRNITPPAVLGPGHDLTD